MEEDLRQLIELAIRRQDGNPLWPDGFQPFCEKHGIDVDRFCYLYAKVVAEEFAHGEMSYADGDVAMNQLSTIMDIDLRESPWTYIRPSMLVSSIETMIQRTQFPGKSTHCQLLWKRWSVRNCSHVPNNSFNR